MKALIIEDDLDVARAVRAALEEEFWDADIENDGRVGLNKALVEEYEVIILDLMLPEMDGLQIVREIRRASSMTPVIFLTARDSVMDRVNGLDEGADDYLVKPFEVSELLARVRALTRRKGSIVRDDRYEYGRLSVIAQAHDGYVDQKPLHLTVKEFELFSYLIQNAEQILTRDQIFYRVWGFHSDSGSAVVDVYVHYLRKKLVPFSCEGLIQTIRGVGFMLKG